MTKLNAVVGQSGGPTAAINATLAGVIAGCLADEKIETVYGMKNGIEGFEKQDLIDLCDYFSDEFDENLELLSLTPAAALGSCRKKIKDDAEIEKIYEVLEKFNIGYFFYIGGNDSMDTVARLTDYAERHKDDDLFDVKFIGVPKTVDNDLPVTDHTPGYGSAAKFVAASMQEICRDCAVYTKKAVTIVEIMGRDAGWLTASSVLSKHISGVGPDLVYLPEKVFDEDKFIEDVNEKLNNSDKPYVIVAVSEGVKNADGSYVAEKKTANNDDPFGHKVLTGAGKALEGMVLDRIGCKCRSVELNILQRCASHIGSACDIEESVMIGRGAVKFALEGQSGVMVCVKRAEGEKYVPELFTYDARRIANGVKSIPQEFLSDDGMGVNEKCVKYMMPLIMGENNVKYHAGLPVHFGF